MSPLLRSGNWGKSTSRVTVTPPRAAAPSKQPPPPNVGVKNPVPAQVVRAPRRGVGKIRGVKAIIQKDLPAFSRQMAAMLSAGMPIVAALETLEEQAANPNFKLVLGVLKRSIEGGSSFSESLQQMPDVFDVLYVNMVRAGEQSGQFAETMRRIGALLEATARLRRKVKSAMTYPVVVLSLSLIIATGMIIFIVPVFAGMFSDFGGKLPAPTQFLVDLSAAGKKYGVIIVPGIMLAVWGFKKWKKTPAGGWVMDRFALKAPVFGVLIQKVAIARFSRTLSQLVQSGVPILNALEIVAKAAGNRIIESAILEARKAVEHGDTLSSGLDGKECIPKLVVRMLSAGEKTGKVDEMLESVADTYDDEVEAMLAALTSLLEPLLMVFLGVVIGGIVVAMFMPIFKMVEIIK
ncbi:MAG: type II secretion system F family protein [bacterium]